MINCKECNSTNILIIKDNVEFFVNGEDVLIPMESSLCVNCKHEFINDEQIMKNLINMFVEEDSDE